MKGIRIETKQVTRYSVYCDEHGHLNDYYDLAAAAERLRVHKEFHTIQTSPFPERVGPDADAS